MQKDRVLKLLKAAALAVFLGVMSGAGKGFGLFFIPHLLRQFDEGSLAGFLAASFLFNSKVGDKLLTCM